MDDRLDARPHHEPAPVLYRCRRRETEEGGQDGEDENRCGESRQTAAGQSRQTAMGKIPMSRHGPTDSNILPGASQEPDFRLTFQRPSWVTCPGPPCETKVPWMTSPWTRPVKVVERKQSQSGSL